MNDLQSYIYIDSGVSRSTLYIGVLRVYVCLTLRRAESTGGRDHGEGGAAVHGAQVVLHVGVDVGVRRAEGRLPGGARVRRQADQGDVGDDGAAC